MRLLKMLRLMLLLMASAMLVACGSDGSNNQDATDDSDAQLDGDIGDPCEAVTQCEQARVCDGASLVVCAPDANGCLVEQMRQDCAATEFGSCNNELGQCVVDNPCEGIPNQCDTEGEVCDADRIVRCAPNAIGCLVETQTDCSNQGATCIESEGVIGCGFDPCASKDQCTTPGRTCNADVLEVCQRDIYGCLVQKTYNCVNRGGTCDDGGPITQCSNNPCANECTESSQTCDGTDLEVCALNEFGCFEAFTANCTQTSVGQGYCNTDNPSFNQCDITFNANCSEFDTCPLAGARCDGDTLVECGANDFACLVETRTDCTEMGVNCVDVDGVASCEDPCTLIETCPAELYCDGTDLVTCLPDQYGCLLEDSRVDCLMMGQTCDENQMPTACYAIPNATGSSSPGTPIADYATITDTITIAAPCTVGTMTVTVDISHTFIGDLNVDLQAPDNTIVRLHARTGSSSDNIVGTYPVDLTPNEPLSGFTGKQAQGVWTMSIQDNAGGDQGTLNSWSFNITCGL